MLSERRMAQCGLCAATLVLVTTLTIVYQGGAAQQPALQKNGQRAQAGDKFQRPQPKIAADRIASTGK
jgi:hypothetical protein